MTRLPSDHLNDEEIQQWLESHSDLPAAAKDHLDSCKECKMLVDNAKSLQDKLVSLKNPRLAPTPDCPPQTIWWSVIEGLTSANESQELLSHAGVCAHCALQLQQAISDSTVELDLSEPPTADELKEKIARLVGPGKPLRRSTQRPVWLNWRWAAAAAAVIAIAVFLVPRRNSAQHVDTLLAEAYTDQRTLEFRIPGAAHARMRTERGSAAADSPLLREAQRLISAGLEKGNDPAWLHAQARYMMLVWRADEAMAFLDKARANGARNAELLNDEALAHFERAQINDDNGEYDIALDLLSQAPPDDSVLCFNRAILYEHLSRKQEALAEWNQFLRLEPSGGWAGEARARLERLSK